MKYKKIAGIAVPSIKLGWPIFLLLTTPLLLVIIFYVIMAFIDAHNKPH